MKKKLLILFGIMVLFIIASTFIIKIAGKKDTSDSDQTDNKLKIVTTFYPVYMIGLNLADQIEDMEVSSLTKLNTGCLHDYQLTTEDMKLISSADILVINGGGMEGFLEDVTKNYPELTIIDASQGITMLSNVEGEFELEEANEEEDHGEYNPHVWLDPKLYIQQIENVRDGIINYINEADSDTKTEVTEVTQSIQVNAQTYIQKITELDTEIDAIMQSSEQSLEGQQAVIFHDSFAYLANRVGMKVAFTVPLDSDTSLSAGDIAEIIDEVKTDDIKYLFTEQQYSDSIAKQISAETGSSEYIIDSVVTGDGAKDSYLTAMTKNLNILKESIQ